MDRCNLCGAASGSGAGAKLLRCSSCKAVYYCSAEHQKADWAVHRNACTHLQSIAKSGRQWEANIPKDEYSGTFRWYEKTDFMQLPPLTDPWRQLPRLEGWTEYFNVRLADGSTPEDGGGDMTGPATEPKRLVLEPATIDALSFPLSLVWAIKQAVQVDKDVKDAIIGGAQSMSLVALGCSQRAEEHILMHTNYFAEIAPYFFKRDIHLWLVGPEMSSGGHMVEKRLADNMVATCYRGTCGGFLKEHLSGTATPPPKVIFVGFNTGMASGDEALRASWAQDLQQLLQRDCLTVFTAANDHSDIKGERQMMEQVLDAKYVLFPRRNPFAAVTVLHPPGGRESSWYSANAFVYAVKGFNTSKAGTQTLSTERNGLATSGSQSKPQAEQPNRQEQLQQQQQQQRPPVVSTSTANRQAEAASQPLQQASQPAQQGASPASTSTSDSQADAAGQFKQQAGQLQRQKVEESHNGASAGAASRGPVVATSGTTTGAGSTTAGTGSSSQGGVSAVSPTALSATRLSGDEHGVSFHDAGVEEVVEQLSGTAISPHTAGGAAGQDALQRRDSGSSSENDLYLPD